MSEKLQPKERWQNQPVTGRIKIGDLDTEEIQRTVETAIHLGRMEPINNRRDADILRGFGLLENGRLLNAAVAPWQGGTSARHLFSVQHPHGAIPGHQPPR